MDINELIQRVEDIDIMEVIDDSVNATRPELVRLQRLQMLKGENRKGFKIGIYRSKVYAIKKHLMNPLAGQGFVDLRDKEDFYKGIFADDREEFVVIDSEDEKTGKLIEKYGEEIFGLNEEHALEYSNEYLGPEITEKITNLIYK